MKVVSLNRKRTSMMMKLQMRLSVISKTKTKMRQLRGLTTMMRMKIKKSLLKSRLKT